MEKQGVFYRNLPEKILTHREFQEELALQLFQDGYQLMKAHLPPSDHDTLERVLICPTAGFLPYIAPFHHHVHSSQQNDFGLMLFTIL